MSPLFAKSLKADVKKQDCSRLQCRKHSKFSDFSGNSVGEVILFKVSKSIK